jgi:hypothetical protein
VVTVLDRPGRLVQRCVLGNLRRVWVHLRDGSLLVAEVERVSLAPTQGRTCALRLAPLVPTPLA